MLTATIFFRLPFSDIDRRRFRAARPVNHEIVTDRSRARLCKQAPVPAKHTLTAPQSWMRKHFAGITDFLLGGRSGGT